MKLIKIFTHQQIIIAFLRQTITLPLHNCLYKYRIQILENIGI